MNIVAYCRVSTDKEDQLNSLETQKKFFIEYAERHNHKLVGIYADEGLTGTRTKKRKEFLRLMADAHEGIFELVVVKDISRLARNTVDLLQSVRTLKSLNIEMLFLTANMTTLGNSEFVLTIFGALAQEESANMSKRVKFSKKINAEKGRVPNLVFGYDKTPGDYFNLEINVEEAVALKRMFQLYTEEGYGTMKIANYLNDCGIKTKRGGKWTQATVGKMLQNKLYIGQVINGKEEVTDFLTGVRQKNDESDWEIVYNPSLCIIDEDVFEKAQKILKNRHTAFNITHERHSNKHLFSTIIKCKECGWSFRRFVYTYKNTYVRWGCSGRNGKGTHSCPNATTIDEGKLIEEITSYFTSLIKSKDEVIAAAISEYEKKHTKELESDVEQAELKARVAKLRKTRQKYIDMYTDDLISREELNTKLDSIKEGIEELELKLDMTNHKPLTIEQIKKTISRLYNNIEDIVDVSSLNNTQLKKIISKIEVDKDGNVDIFLNELDEISLIL